MFTAYQASEVRIQATKRADPVKEYSDPNGRMLHPFTYLGRRNKASNDKMSKLRSTI